MAWHFVSSRKLQPGQLYGVWLTTTGVTSTDEILQWLSGKGWHVTTIWARGTHPNGVMVKEMHAVWTGRDATVLPAADPHVFYGALYISDSGAIDSGPVPERAPGERPPPPPEVVAAMNPLDPPAGRWKFPAVMAAAALTIVTVIRGRPGPPTSTTP